MSLLRHSAWIHGRTGEQLWDPGGMPNGHAVYAISYVYAPAPLPGLEGLPDGALLVIDTHLDLGPFRLERGMSAREHGYAYTHHELKAAFEHPCVTRERIVEGIEPPERGRRLALYDAVAWWIGHVESEWRGLGFGKAIVGPADECLEPVLLDLHHEWRVGLTRQGREWLHGTSERIPQSAAREAERCLRAALETCAGVLARSLDDQLAATVARANATWSVDGPDALQCARVLLEPFYSGGHPVLWRPVVDLASSAERVRLEMRPGDPEDEPTRIEIDRAQVEFVIAPGRGTIAHDADRERLREVGARLAARARAAVTRAREARRTGRDLPRHPGTRGGRGREPNAAVSGVRGPRFTSSLG